MDILLTHGYFLNEDPHEKKVMKPYPPLGILYISSHLKDKGFDVGVFDSTFENFEGFERLLAEERPGTVGIYCNLMTRGKVLKMISAAKNINAYVVVGGPEPTNYAEEYLSRGADVVVDGEGEMTLEELVPHLARFGMRKLEVINGIAYGEQRPAARSLPREQIQSLDDQPLPDRPAIDIHKYVDVWRRHHGMGSVSLITARGCPYKCTWCSHSVYGYTHRRRSPANVADELVRIRETYSPDMVWYADDVFTINHRWLYAYHTELKDRGIRLPFETISREDRLNEKVVRTLAEMGCFRLWIGSESGSQEILDGMKRQTDAGRVREMTHLLRRYGIQTGMFIMLGYEGEQMPHLEETLEHLKKAEPDVFLTTLAYPIKGTPYYETVADRVIPIDDWATGSDRDLSVTGRPSTRFYSYANRWIVSEMALEKRRKNGIGNPLTYAKQIASAKVGRAGMLLTKNEREEA
ncbi:MAG: radical SAM protein [Anaerolineales bacterium]|nr:radical SAM protein [Anaerolineales bacterium]